jgi:hypothetical protein
VVITGATEHPERRRTHEHDTTAQEIRTAGTPFWLELSSGWNSLLGRVARLRDPFGWRGGEKEKSGIKLGRNETWSVYITPELD